MIIENVKVRLEQIKGEIDFIKECLWPRRPTQQTERFARTTGRWKFLSWPKKSFGSKQKNKSNWK